jgi:hypothetical protein
MLRQETIESRLSASIGDYAITIFLEEGPKKKENLDSDPAGQSELILGRRHEGYIA